MADYVPTKAERDALIRAAVNEHRPVDTPPSVEERAGLIERLGLDSPSELADVLGLQPSQVVGYMTGTTDGEGVLTGNMLRKADAVSRELASR